MPKIPRWIFLLIAILHLSAIRIDTMDVDASQYAEMSREMSVSQDYLHLYDRGTDYLDKPPMLFWLSSTSMRVFGVNNLGYKLPSILFLFLALYATYRLCRLLYDENTGRIAALVLAVCQGSFLMTNDVRTDTMLMGFVATALWAIKECEIKRRWYFVLLGVAAIAGGLMTKGPIALFVPLFAFGADWILKRKWKAIFNPYHLLDALLILALLIPMCIGLYQQYDLHPEKLIGGKTGTSGLRFFFWTQSFGRITGENSWNNGADISFLLVSMLWAFLPWVFLFLAALGISLRDIIRQRFRLNEAQEWVSTGGFILSYLALGMSHYQLPHYIFVAFPLASVMVAALLRRFFAERDLPKLYRGMNVAQFVICILLCLGLFLIITFTFPSGILLKLAWLAGLVTILLIAWKVRRARLLWVSTATMILLNIFLTHYFYANLLRYQCGSQAGRWIKEQGISAQHFQGYRMKDPLVAIHFYGQQIFAAEDTGFHSGAGDYVLTMPEELPRIAARGWAWDELWRAQFFKVSELTPDFLNAKTRYKAVHDYRIIRLRAAPNPNHF